MVELMNWTTTENEVGSLFLEERRNFKDRISLLSELYK